MTLAHDNRNNGLAGHPRAASTGKTAAGGGASDSAKFAAETGRKAGDSSISASPRDKLDENLFSDDARRQYAALKELQLARTITKRRYDRVHEIRWSTRHLALAELGEKILEEKRARAPTWNDTHQEIMTQVRQFERAQREKLLKALQEETEIALPRGAATRWLASAALAGFLLGGVLTYLLVPSGGPAESKSAAAYIDTRTGSVISDGTDPEKHEAATAKGDYQPAYYCWKCQKWLPVKNPQKRAGPAVGPMQALVDRPVVIHSKKP